MMKNTRMNIRVPVMRRKTENNQISDTMMMTAEILLQVELVSMYETQILTRN